MSISSIANSGKNLQNYYQSLSSGKRINSAKDDASGLAIANKMRAEATADDVRVQNGRDAQNMINIQDGSMSSVTDGLQRIRELSVQASNGLYSEAERSSIQSEIDHLKESFGSDTLQSLGIADYDVTSGDFDISRIDDALESVMSVRSDLGAKSNGLDHMMANLSNTSLNLTASRSRIEDLDYGRAVTGWKTEETMHTYSVMMQKKKMEEENGRVMRLFGNN